QQHSAQRSFSFYPGVGYRHLCVWHGGIASLRTTPPHDITGREIACYLPQGDGAETLLTLMHESRELLERHPVNEKRRSLGEKLVSSIWLWGQGGAPRIQPLTEKYSLKGAVISAVDLLNGTGTYAGLRVIRVAGATGYIDTNYQGKANAALQALESGDDFVLVHVEAPDEMGHEGNLKGKIKAIEDFDKLVVGTILEGLPDFGDYRVMVLSDHLTPIALKTHTADPTIFAAWSSATKKNRHPDLSFSESCAKQGGLLISPGHLLFEAFIHGRL
ncbi:MAG: phosphoglycerate mutase, partial [Deltaproteobacteria bacterium]|nr:phosphoglycerate mutase [Deltaproteobacteria bacterium]